MDRNSMLTVVGVVVVGRGVVADFVRFGFPLLVIQMGEEK